jgi:methionine aminopeptidase
MSDADSASDDEQDEVKANDLSDPEIVTKYRLAGDIATKALAKVLSLIEAGASPLALCEAGDALIVEACGQVYSKSKIEKGVAFPTCISVNHCAGHFSPLPGEDGEPLAAGDVVKVDLGVQLDAYATQVAHTVVCPVKAGTPPPAVPSKAADVIKAAHDASELAQRMLKAGCKNSELTAMIESVAGAYGVSAMQGVLSHQVRAPSSWLAGGGESRCWPEPLPRLRRRQCGALDEGGSEA